MANTPIAFYKNKIVINSRWFKNSIWKHDWVYCNEKWIASFKNETNVYYKYGSVFDKLIVCHVHKCSWK